MTIPLLLSAMSVNAKIKLPLVLLLTALLICCVLPFAYDQKLLDFDSTPRWLMLSIFLSIVQIYYWRQPTDTTLFLPPRRSLFEWCFISFIAWRCLCAFVSYDSGDALYECSKLIILFITWMHFTFLIRRFTIAPVYLQRCVMLAAFVFAAIGLTELVPAFYSAMVQHKPFVALSRYGSVFFNKNFFSESVVMTLSFTTIICFNKGSTVWRILAALCLVLSLFVLLALQSVSAWLAVIAGALTFIILFFWQIRQAVTQSYRTRLALITTLMFFVAVPLIWIYTNSANTLKLKFQTLVDIVRDPQVMAERKSYNSFTERWLGWKHTWMMIQEHPLVGSGTANWKVIIPKFGPYGQRFMDGGTFRFEHPHNEFLFIAAENGLVGVSLFLALILTAIVGLRRRLVKSVDRHEKFEVSLYGAGIVAFVVMACFGYPFQRFYSAVLLMLLFAFAIQRNVSVSLISADSSRRVWNNWLLISFVVCAYTAVIFFQRYRGERFLRAAQLEQVKKNWQTMYSDSKSSKSFAFKADLLGAPIDWYAGFAKFYSGDAAAAEPFFESATRQNPYFIQGWNDLGTCYEKRKLYKDAIRCYKTALTINPTFNNSLLNLTAAYYNSGFVDSAYATIVRHPHYYGAVQYRTFLLAVVRSKLTPITEVDDFALKEKMMAVLKNEKLVIGLFDESERSGKKIEEIYVNMFK